MELAPGARLGPYEITAQIGAGGMGVVYQARDTRLGRDVAVKVLSSDATTDPSRRQRFQREARAVAALTHPHICGIHDVGSEGALDYIVLELLDGESLATRLQRGPLPVEEALVRAREIASAVGHAHRVGIVHRDLKPANVMLTRSGAKVLDFGLARYAHNDDTPAGHTTVTESLATELGTVMGTLPYMAPEQIEGRTVDARADVFAFGATLYEMLTAKRAFDAPSGPALMATILRGETPSILTIDDALPEMVDRVIRTCLAKNPDDRFTDLNDTGIALRWAADDLASAAGRLLADLLGDVVKRIQIPTELADWIAQGLRDSVRELEQTRQESLAPLTQRRRSVQAKLDRGYDDYLEGRISDGFWARKAEEWESELSAIDAELGRLSRPTPTYAATGEKILELAKTAHFEYLQQSFPERRRLLDSVLSDCTFDRGTLCPTYLKPFDLLSQGNETGNWRGRRDSNPRPPA